MHTGETNGIARNGNPAQLNTAIEKDDEIKKLLINHKGDNPSLDICNRNIRILPSELFILAHLQHLYLEGNCLVDLPENFFDRLPALLWLDLRNNQLTSLPASIGRHQCIKHLLLEENCLTHLPLQLGMTKTITGLSLQGNPLQYPPQHIVDQGVYVILSFLYQELQNRSRQSDSIVIKEMESLNVTDNHSNSSEEEILTENINLTDRKISSPHSDDFQLLRNGRTPVPASLHRPMTYQDYKGKFNADGFSESVRGGRLKNNKELSLLHLRHQSDARKEQLRMMRERQSAFVEQRRKLYNAQQNRLRNGTTQKFPSTPVIEATSPVPSAGDTGQPEIRDNIHEEKVEKIYPNYKVGKLRRRWLLRNGRPKVRVTEKARTNVVRKSSQNHLEEARKLLAELGMTKDEKLLAATQKSSSRKFLLDKPPFKSVRKNAMIQRKIKQHSLEIQNKIKQLKNESLPPAEGDSVTWKGLQRELLDEKMKRQHELEYRFRAFTGSSRSTKSGSNKTTST